MRSWNVRCLVERDTPVFANVIVSQTSMPQVDARIRTENSRQDSSMPDVSIIEVIADNYSSEGP